jgi:hypothetical protein
VIADVSDDAYREAAGCRSNARSNEEAPNCIGPWHSCLEFFHDKPISPVAYASGKG